MLPSEFPTPKRITEEDSGFSNMNMGSEHFILEQIKILSQEVVKIGEKIRENEYSRQNSLSEN